MEAFLQFLPIVLCFLGGLALTILEAFTPGFGVAGISGILLHLVTIYLVWARFGAAAAVGVTVLILALLGVVVTLTLRSAAKGRLSKSEMILRQTESSEEGYSTSEDLSLFLGLTGKVITTLRPTGTAEFDGVRLNVMSDGEFIEAGTEVQITRVEGVKVIVRAVKDLSHAAGSAAN